MLVLHCMHVLQCGEGSFLALSRSRVAAPAWANREIGEPTSE